MPTDGKRTYLCRPTTQTSSIASTDTTWKYAIAQQPRRSHTTPDSSTASPTTTVNRSTSPSRQRRRTLSMPLKSAKSSRASKKPGIPRRQTCGKPRTDKVKGQTLIGDTQAHASPHGNDNKTTEQTDCNNCNSNRSNPQQTDPPKHTDMPLRYNTQCSP